MGNFKNCFGLYPVKPPCKSEPALSYVPVSVILKYYVTVSQLLACGGPLTAWQRTLLYYRLMFKNTSRWYPTLLVILLSEHADFNWYIYTTLVHLVGVCLLGRIQYFAAFIAWKARQVHCFMN